MRAQTLVHRPQRWLPAPPPEEAIALPAPPPPVWGRGPGDGDVAVVRVGTGIVAARVRLAAPVAEMRTDDQGDLWEAALAAVDATAWVSGAPCTLPLLGEHPVAVVGPPGRAREVVRGWLLELTVLHGPDELRI